MKTSIKSAIVFFCILASGPASAGIVVHECGVHYHWIDSDTAGRKSEMVAGGEDKTVLLAEGIDSNVMIAEESTDRDRTDLDVSVSADGKVHGTVVPPLGGSGGRLEADGTFVNGLGDVYGKIECSPRSRTVDSLIRDEEDGDLFSVGLGLPGWRGGRAASALLLYRRMCYFGSTADALREVSEGVQGRAQAVRDGDAIALGWQGTKCLRDNGQSYEAYQCLDEAPDAQSRAIGPCDGNWVNWRNVPYAPPQRSL